MLGVRLYGWKCWSAIQSVGLPFWSEINYWIDCYESWFTHPWSLDDVSHSVLVIPFNLHPITLWRMLTRSITLLWIQLVLLWPTAFESYAKLTRFCLKCTHIFLNSCHWITLILKKTKKSRWFSSKFWNYKEHPLDFWVDFWMFVCNGHLK